jgi:FtsP/CotA-like multicopper oxidase with cupredoxin domain
MQIAQDGVQLDDANYKDSGDKPFYLAPANRVDLLVQAPLQETSAEIRIQNVIARSKVKPTPKEPNPVPGTVLLTVEIAGPAVERDNKPLDMPMPFLDKAPDLPEFLKDIDHDKKDLRQNNYTTRKFVFETSGGQHKINDIKFEEGHAHVKVLMDTIEEWVIENKTVGNTIDHPFHIHINPFQLVEVFDPNETFFSDKTKSLLRRYETIKDEIVDSEEQCFLDPADQSTWKQCKPKKDKFIWHDVYAIPSGINKHKTNPLGKNKDKDDTDLLDAGGRPVIIPGFFRMRSRFVDYPGLYVMHCHILIHEDRGMMFSVEVLKTKATEIRHH